MKVSPLLEGLTFDERRPRSEPLLVDDSGRVLRFSLLPGQQIKEHCAPHSPVHILVLKGQGMFAGKDGRETLLGPDSLVVYEAGELHSVRALDRELVFVALLHKVEKQVLDKTTHDEAENYYLTWFM